MMTSLTMTSVEISKFCLACELSLPWATLVLNFTYCDTTIIPCNTCIFMYFGEIFLQVDRGFSKMTSFCPWLLVYQVYCSRLTNKWIKQGDRFYLPAPPPHRPQWYTRLLEPTRNRVKTPFFVKSISEREKSTNFVSMRLWSSYF